MLRPKQKFAFLCLVIAALFLLPGAADAAPAGPVAGPGDIVLVGYNADDGDGLAFVLLGDAAAGLEIHFRDDEWNGSGWNDANEGTLTWKAPVAGAAAGTVVAINDTSSAPAASLGAAVGSLNLNTADEVLYAYLGPVAAPAAFLAALASDGFTAANGEISGTGLVAGSTAIDFDGIDDDVDVAVYAGSRTNQASAAAYRAQIHDLTGNWLTDDGSGDQSGDGVPPDLPFDTTPFQTPTAVSLQILHVSPGPGSPLFAAVLSGLLLVTVPVAAQRARRHRGHRPGSYPAAAISPPHPPSAPLSPSLDRQPPPSD